uniref:Uncharacterized protein n=1 Tax=Anguilla anguilla TaxID=7936 RepID=A0A0E9TSV9_ANGAN
MFCSKQENIVIPDMVCMLKKNVRKTFIEHRLNVIKTADVI